MMVLAKTRGRHAAIASACAGIAACSGGGASSTGNSGAGGVIAFARLDGNVNHIYLMSVAATGSGGIPTRLTTDAESENYPSWSPDGTQIVYARLASAPAPNTPSVTEKIAFEYDIAGMQQSDPTAYAEVWTMNADGSGQIGTGVQCSDVGCAPRWQPL